ncbi:MAG TPA: hypothetical protein GXZ74_06300 [Tissierellia bacterium]|nr:hypothetical protein [Tissierellia bacterium]
MLINLIVILISLSLLIIAGRKAWRDLKSTRCGGCTRNCQAMQPVTITLKKDPK